MNELLDFVGLVSIPVMLIYVALRIRDQNLPIEDFKLFALIFVVGLLPVVYPIALIVSIYKLVRYLVIPEPEFY